MTEAINLVLVSLGLVYTYLLVFLFRCFTSFIVLLVFFLFVSSKWLVKKAGSLEIRRLAEHIFENEFQPI